MKKMEKEMETVFDTKVSEKRSKLKQSEQELMRKHEQVTTICSIGNLLYFLSKRKSTKLILPNWNSEDESLSVSETSGKSGKRAFRHGIIF